MNRTVVRGEMLYWIYISYYVTDMDIADIISLPDWSSCQNSPAIILIWIQDSTVALVLIILLPRENSTLTTIAHNYPLHTYEYSYLFI